MRALRLLSYTKQVEVDADASSTTYSIQLSEDVLGEVLLRFTGLPNVLPVLSVGQSGCGSTIILDKLVASSSHTDREPEGEGASFFNSDEDPPENVQSEDDPTEGVYIWPYPVQVGDQSLLLIKMWDIDFNEKDEEMKLLTQKVLYCLFSVTSVCFQCVETSWIFPSLEIFEGIYEDLSRSGLKMSKFFAFTKDAGTFKRNPYLKLRDSHQSGAYGPMTEFLYRGGEGISEANLATLIEKLANPETHMQFVDTHRTASEKMGCDSAAVTLSIIFKTLVNIAKMDMDYVHMVANIPHFNSAKFAHETTELELKVSQSTQIKLASGRNLFYKSPESYRLDDAVFKEILKTYNLEAPTIVMIILGNQGMGKSTLLNHVVQFHSLSREKKMFFTTGNTDDHTTLDSQVLSHPLILAGTATQLMLIDMEGLGGMETSDPIKARMQSNLISAILTVASVPCFLVKNEANLMDEVELMIEKISFLQRDFGLLMERIHFLFYDKDLREGETTNEEMKNRIKSLNSKYFSAQEVIVLTNKPNFAIESKANDCETFLRDLMKNCNYPKKSVSGTPTNLKQLLTRMSLITKHRNTNLRELHLSQEEESKIMSKLAEKKAQLDSIAVSCKSSDESTSLVPQFIECYQRLLSQTNLELKAEGFTKNMQLSMATSLEIEISVHKLKLSEVENVYFAIRDLVEADLIVKVEAYLDTLYREAWWLGSFSDRAKVFKEKLKQVRIHYPAEAAKMTAVLRAFRSKRGSLRNWFLFNYAFQAAATVASGGLGLAAKGATVAVNVARFGWAAVAAAVSVLGRQAYGITTSFAITEPTFELFILQPSVSINPKFTETLKQLQADAPTSVLLVIGKGDMEIGNCLSGFARHVSPLTSPNLAIFDEKKRSQVLPFSYERHEIHNEVEVIKICQAILVYMRLDAMTNTVSDKRLVTIAARLMLRASAVYLYVSKDPSDTYLIDVLTAFQRPESQPSTAKLKITLRDLGSTEEKRLKITEKLIQHELTSSAEAIEGKMTDEDFTKVKSDLDQSVPFTYAEFEEVLNGAVSQANAAQ